MARSSLEGVGMTDNEKTLRDSGNGQFVHALESMCRCGHTVGAHAAKTINGRRECFEADCDCQKVRKFVCKKA